MKEEIGEASIRQRRNQAAATVAWHGVAWQLMAGAAVTVNYITWMT